MEEDACHDDGDEGTAYSYPLSKKQMDTSFLDRVVAAVVNGCVALDLGCGPHCQAARYFAAATSSTATTTKKIFTCIIATDIDDAACVAAAKCTAGHHGVQVRQLDARLGFEQLGVSAGPSVVGLISIFYVLQHLTESETSLLFHQCSARLASPGGVLAVAALLDQDTSSDADGGAAGTAVGPLASPHATAAAAAATTSTLPRLDPLFRGMYKSFTTVTLLTDQLAAAGFTALEHVSTRPAIYPNEFPCDRVYIIATKK